MEHSFNDVLKERKYEEQKRAILFTNQLKSLNIGISELQTLNYMLGKSLAELLYIVNENTYIENLFSIVANLKSAVASNLGKPTLSHNFEAKVFFMSNY